MGHRRTMLNLAVAVVSSVAAACGGGQEANQPASSSSTAAASSSAPTPAAVNRCPLTAEQVSTAVRAPVTGPNDACMFAPGDDLTARPNVTFVRQVSFACNGTMPADVGYKEQVPGLGPTAYIAPEGGGTRLLVCQGQTPFEIEVDAETPELRRDAAIALARLVLAGS